MPGIDAFGSMGGMSAVNFRYQNLAANRRQNSVPTDTESEEANESTQSATARASASAVRQSPPPPPPQEAAELPSVDALGSASETLAQMRIQPADAADAAFELFRTQTETQGVEQTPPQAPPQTPPPPRNGEAPAEGTEEAVTPPPREGQVSPAPTGQTPPPPPNEAPAADGVGRAAPLPPNDNAAPMQQPVNQQAQNEVSPLVATAAGIV